ncbi:MAG TPA: hypothetical protein VKB38_00705 [Terracidiphilus sp.]|nr:hypothetical protein [Terracidiphilus sp.]
MGVPVALFNASTQAITVDVNNGPRTLIHATGESENWLPQTQYPGTGPGYSQGYAAPNVIGNLGQNYIAAFVGGVQFGHSFVFSLPTNYPVHSVQIYFFSGTGKSASWSVLTDGVLCAQQTRAAQAESSKFEPEQAGEN